MPNLLPDLESTHLGGVTMTIAGYMHGYAQPMNMILTVSVEPQNHQTKLNTKITGSHHRYINDCPWRHIATHTHTHYLYHQPGFTIPDMYTHRMT